MSLVRLRVTELALLEGLLHLPAGTTLAGADCELRDADCELRDAGGDLVLTVDWPGAPAGAETVDLTYTRHTCPGPVSLTGVRWLGAGGAGISDGGSPA